jgi:phage DNA packaging protein, nu1 subunit of terminase
MEVNQKELAACLGITSRRVRQLREEGLFQFAPGSKRYSLGKCVQEYIEFKIDEETGRKGNLDKERVSAEHEEIKKQISEIKLKRLKREMHRADDVELFLTDMLLHFKQKLTLLPPKLAIGIIGETDVNLVVKKIEAGVNDALSELAEYNPDEIERTEEKTEGEEGEE